MILRKLTAVFLGLGLATVTALAVVDANHLRAG
jgi:hypothetical protein